MSLMNDVLKDLDDRRAGNEAVSRNQQGASIAPVRKSKNKLNVVPIALVLIVLIAVVALGAFLYHLYGDYQQRLTQSDAQKSIAEAMLNPVPEETVEQIAPVREAADQIVEEAGAQISDVFITPLDQGARIEIQLSKKVAHEISATSQEQMVVQLPNTELTSLLPSVSEHPLVDAIDVAVDNNNLALTVGLAQPAISQTYLLKRGQYYALIVELFAAEQQDPVEQPSELKLESEVEQSPAVAMKASPVESQTDPEEVELPASEQEKPRIFSKTASAPSFAEQDRNASKRALNQLRAGKTEEAITELQTFIADNPKAHRSRETLLVWALSQQRFELAETVLVEGRELAPENAVYIKLHARLMIAKNQSEQALVLMNNNLPRHNLDAEYLAIFASLLQQQGRHFKAVEVYRELVKRDSNQAQAWVGQAISLEALGLKQDALRAYLEARRIPAIDARLKQYAESRIQALN